MGPWSIPVYPAANSYTQPQRGQFCMGIYMHQSSLRRITYVRIQAMCHQPSIWNIYWEIRWLFIVFNEAKMTRESYLIGFKMMFIIDNHFQSYSKNISLSNYVLVVEPLAVVIFVI